MSPFIIRFIIGHRNTYDTWHEYYTYCWFMWLYQLRVLVVTFSGGLFVNTIYVCPFPPPRHACRVSQNRLQLSKGENDTMWYKLVQEGKAKKLVGLT